MIASVASDVRSLAGAIDAYPELANAIVGIGAAPAGLRFANAIFHVTGWPLCELQ